MNKSSLSVFAQLLIVIIVLWLGLANFVWGIRNPKANRYTFWTHFTEAVTFQKNPAFQE